MKKICFDTDCSVFKGTRDVELPSLSTSSLSDAVFSHILSIAVRDCGSQFLDVSTELLSFKQLLLQPLGAQPVLPLLSYWRGRRCKWTDRRGVRVTADNGHNTDNSKLTNRNSMTAWRKLLNLNHYNPYKPRTPICTRHGRNIKYLQWLCMCVLRQFHDSFLLKLAF